LQQAFRSFVENSILGFSISASVVCLFVCLLRTFAEVPLENASEDEDVGRSGELVHSEVMQVTTEALRDLRSRDALRADELHVFDSELALILK
jgi:hypothetical protein